MNQAFLPSSMRASTVGVDAGAGSLVGPLSWVQGEIRAALLLAVKSAGEAYAAEGDARSSALAHARAFLHQAHGALQTLELQGVSAITGDAEALIGQVDAGLVTLDGALVGKLERACQALSEYLEELVLGAPQQPVRLFSYRRALLEAMGAERIHPADLFFPDLRAPGDFAPYGLPEPTDANVLRQTYERSLLRFLKSGASADAAQMAAVLGTLGRSRAEAGAQQLWWALQAYAHAFAVGALALDMQAKQLFSRINKQLRRPEDGTAETDGLLRDALFFLALASPADPLVAAVREAWALDGLVPADYQRQRYGLIDPALLNTARERVTHAAQLWTRIAEGDLACMSTFEQDLESLEAACAGLDTPPLTALVATLRAVAPQIASGARAQPDCVEVATGILMVESTLKEIRRLPEGFALRIEAMQERLQAAAAGRPMPQNLDSEESHRLAQLEAMQVLAVQMQSGLQEVEKILDDYFRVPAALDVLANVVPLLHQIEGGLAILGQDAAVLALRHAQIVVTRLAEGLVTPDVTLFEGLAMNLGALGLFMDMLRVNPEEARRQYFFDAGSNLFRVRPGVPKAQKPARPPLVAALPPAPAPAPAPALAPAPKPEPEPVAVAEKPLVQEPAPDMKRIGGQDINLNLYGIFRKESTELLDLLAADLQEWRATPARFVNIQAVHAAHSLSGSSATIGLQAMQALANALENLLQSLVREPVTLAPHEFDQLEAAITRLRCMADDADAGSMPVPDEGALAALQGLQAALGAHAAISPVADEAAVVEDAPELTSAPAPAEPAEALPAVAVEEGVVPQALLVDAFLTSRFETEVMALQDAPDPDLLPIFLEEARDILPQIGRALRDWRRHPEDAELSALLLRLAHTLKGSARMAGAMRLGQHMHNLETRIENCRHVQPLSAQIFDELLVHHDRSVQLFEQLGEAGQDEIGIAAPAAGSDSAAAEAAAPAAGMADAAAVPRREAALLPAAGAAPLVRVRADILDRLVNQAGEVAISRSRMETEVNSLRQALGELGESLQRLRGQLREVELQADAQINARSITAVPGARDFDPLEFDRYTRLQELTRMMAESVDDANAAQHNLAGALANAAGDLSAQGRMTRDLQQDLLRVRMVQFGSLADRLYRVVRQTAKDTGKRVNLDIRGGALEVDRGVLDRMVGAFEHLLRNAIVHGIEDDAARRAAGKSETGDITLEVRQDGNEVVLLFADDGRGIDYAAVRARAIAAGLLAEDAPASEADLRELLFRSGFSTAASVTENAGRGVGMDVVRAEAASLGGSVALSSTAGQGTRVAIRLPLTLAVTQIVLLGSGGQTYAVPSASVEQVVQLKKEAFALAYRDGAVQWQGQRVPMVYLGRLLGQRQASPADQAYAPVIILRQGSQRVAVHVDEVMGNREVVVKRTGPQIGRLTGVSGAAVLASGQIVVIVDPLRLVGREILPPADDAPQAAVHQASILVVDDSMTVRRVTQRMLAREGYQVRVAKDGVEALESLRAELPDLMLADIEMPRMDGFELIRTVRADPATAQLPVIVVSSRTAEKHRATADALGVQGFLGKPYQDGVLLEAIAIVLGKRS